MVASFVEAPETEETKRRREYSETWEFIRMVLMEHREAVSAKIDRDNPETSKVEEMSACTTLIAVAKHRMEYGKPAYPTLAKWRSIHG